MLLKSTRESFGWCPDGIFVPGLMSNLIYDRSVEQTHGEYMRRNGKTLNVSVRSVRTEAVVEGQYGDIHVAVTQKTVEFAAPGAEKKQLKQSKVKIFGISRTATMTELEGEGLDEIVTEGVDRIKSDLKREMDILSLMGEDNAY